MGFSAPDCELGGRLFGADAHSAVCILTRVMLRLLRLLCSAYYYGADAHSAVSLLTTRAHY
eukprot:scaffold99393_cov63-Phaeocystis_antarctica.AAC.2